MSFVRNALSVLTTSVIVAPLGLLTNAILARMLGPETLGAYAVLVNFATIGALLLALGWPSATIYRMRQAGIDPGLVATSGMIAFSSVALVIAVCGLLLEDHVISFLLEGTPPEAYRVGLGLIIAQLFGRLFVALARGIDRFDLANRYTISVAAGTAAVLVGVLTTGDATLMEAISVLFSVYLVGGVGLGVAVLRLTGLQSLFSRVEISASLRYGSKSYVQSIAGQVHEQVDVLMLAAFSVDPASIAYYAIAVGVVNRLKIIPESLSAALFPHVAGLDPQSAGFFAARAARHALAWVFVTTLVLAVACPWVVPLVFGEPFSASVLPILILLPGAAMLTTYSVLSRYFMAINRQGITVRTQLIATTSNVVLNVILIPRMGILGAATSSLISYGMEMLLIVLAFRSESGSSLRRTLILDVADMKEYGQRCRQLLDRRRRPVD